MKEWVSIIGFPMTLILSTFLLGLVGLFYKRRLFIELVFWNLLFGLLFSFLALYIMVNLKEQITDQRIMEIVEVREKTAYFIVLFLTALFVWIAWRKRYMDRLEYFSWLALFFVASPSIAYISYIGNEMQQQTTTRLIEIQVSKVKAEKPTTDKEAFRY